MLIFHISYVRLCYFELPKGKKIEGFSVSCSSCNTWEKGLCKFCFRDRVRTTNVWCRVLSTSNHMYIYI